MPIRSVLVSTKVLIVWGMSNPFLRGGDTRAAIVALTLSWRLSNQSIALCVGSHCERFARTPVSEKHQPAVG